MRMQRVNKSEMGSRKTKKSAPETVSVQDEHLQTVISSANSTNVLLSFPNPPILENESSQNVGNAKSGQQFSIASLCHCSHCIATYAKSKTEQENKKGSAEAEPLEHLKARGAVLFQATHHPKDYLKRAAST